jgi:Family of unknown function (DUF5906)
MSDLTPEVDDAKPRRRTKPRGRTNGRREDADAKLAEMNAKYCVVQDGGKVDVLMFERHVQMIGKFVHARDVPVFLSFESLRNKYCNQTVCVTEQQRNGATTLTPKQLGHWWLKHPGRRQYDGIIFQPGGAEVIANKLNLWKGWGVEPKPGDWSLMREHIKTVVAAGNGESDSYAMNWLAWGVQHPAQRAETALVLKGKRGTGKGTLGNAMMRLYGQHATHISSADHLTGRFNAHLRDACFLFADEAYWPGDKSAEGSFKRLITEQTLFIEGKGRNGVTVPNMLHVMMASNEDWIVPAGEHERRFVVLEVSDCHIQDETYFDALYAQLEDGGYAAMLHDLLHHDISGWHPRRLPKTTTLLDQQRLSLSPLDQWWVELLEIGTLDGADPHCPDHAMSNAHDRKVIESDGYGGKRIRYVKQLGLYDQARRMVPRLRQHASDHALGHFLKKEHGCASRKVLQERGWWFPDLLEARKAWETRFPGWSWRDPTIKTWTCSESDNTIGADPPEEVNNP